MTFHILVPHLLISDADALSCDKMHGLIKFILVLYQFKGDFISISWQHENVNFFELQRSDFPASQVFQLKTFIAFI